MRTKLLKYQAFIFILTSLLVGQALAEESMVAGMVEFASGNATIQRGMKDIPATKGIEIEIGDALVTGEDGRMRILMKNGEKMTLHPKTKFIIDDFEMPESAEKPETGKSFYSFIRGKVDAVVASLGRRDTSSYQVKTTVATMGIRGTGYTMVWGPDGLYVQVTEGSVTLTNAAGTQIVTAGQIGFVGLGGLAPVLVGSMPAAGIGIGTVTGGAAGLGLPAGIAAALGGLAIVAGSDGGSSDTTATTVTVP